MTPRKPGSDLDAEDLSIRARRGDLTPDQHARFERALEASASLRVAHRVGCDFDDVRRVQAGDDQLVARASAKALPRAGKPRSGGSRAAALLAAALIFVASAAAATSAWIVVARFASPAAPNLEPLASAVPPMTADPRLVRPRPSRPEPEAPEGEEAAPVVAPEPALPAATSAARAPASAAPLREATAASLFRDARASRRAGRLAAAEATYAELLAKFPDTGEARVSRVSLGKLLLARGKSREAERQFRAYLATGGGDLTEEALVGRAEALLRLGESSEERRVWQELLRKHPASVYAQRAKQRLEGLTPGAPDEQH